MPALLERIFPFLERRHTRKGLLNLARLATHFGQEDGLEPSRLELWRKVSFLAAYTLMELFVKNSHPGVDWNLKPQCKLVRLDNIVTLFHWMCLYFLSLLKRTGVKGKCVESDYLALKATAERFPSSCVRNLQEFSNGVAFSHRRQFSETWDTDDPNKATSDLCLAIHDLLGLKPSAVVRTVGVVRFKHAALEAFLVSVDELEEPKSGASQDQ